MCRGRETAVGCNVTLPLPLLAFRGHSVEAFRVMPTPKSFSSKPGNSQARQRILAQWRGVDLAPLEKMRASPARLASDLLPKLMKDLKLDDRRAAAEIVKVWNSSIDPIITAHAQPANLVRGTLFVDVDNNVWLSEIVRYRRKEILDRLQHSFGKTMVQKISFRIGG
jgi:predicted nucleic acid-binding Zn ribbon protein